MNQNNFPKVLIIGQTFTSVSGGGITLAGLFDNWPKEKLAVAVGSKEDFDFSRCSNYYRIGYEELKMPFPFHFFQRKTKSGAVSEVISIGEITVKKNSKLKKTVKSIFDDLLNYTGMNFWIYGNEKLSEPFLKWVNHFQPDIIYYQPNSFKSISFVLSLKAVLNIPLCSHVMDDWFTFCVKPSPFYYYWKSKLNKKLKELFAVTQLHLSICDYMSNEYFKRYGHKFHSFHHSINIDFWNRYAFDKNSSTSHYTILYAGRVGYGIDQTLHLIASAIEKAGKENKIILEIQTKDWDHPILKKLKSYSSIKISKPIDYDLLPKKFSTVDALLIPYDFKGSGIKYVKYSMPTKVSEYMATGKPILVIGPSDTALLQYAKTGWAQVCEYNNEKEIIRSIIELKESKALQEKITRTARSLVVKNHNSIHNVNLFREHLINLTEARNKEEEISII